jgi:peptide/nickel transport system permease protein
MTLAAVVTAPVEPVPGPRTQMRWRDEHSILWLLAQRSAIGIVTLFLVSVVVFAATQTLPGSVAKVILGQTATPARVRALTLQLHLNEGAFAQYWQWISGVLQGRLGESYANREPVWQVVSPRLLNSAALVVLAGFFGTVIGVVFGAIAALRKDKLSDHVSSIVALAVTAMPEFVIGTLLVIFLSTVVFHVLPAVSLIPPGTDPWQAPKLLVLPVLTLVIVIVPYIFRMMRAATVEALESDYVEMARLKGVPQWRILVRHALPNAVAPTIQVIGLNFLYLAGGIVVVENVFAYPGIGQGLVSAVSVHDVPVVQFIVVILAAFYVVVNILSDVVALIASPRRRIPR